LFTLVLTFIDPWRPAMVKVLGNSPWPLQESLKAILMEAINET
jgi:hypothetical protein